MTSQATLFKLSNLKFHPVTIHSKRPLHFEALKIRNGKMTRESKSKAFKITLNLTNSYINVWTKIGSKSEVLT